MRGAEENDAQGELNGSVYSTLHFQSLNGFLKGNLRGFIKPITGLMQCKAACTECSLLNKLKLS